MEERTGTDFPIAGPSSSPSGLQQLEATERGDTGGAGQTREQMGEKARQAANVGKEKARKWGGFAKEQAFKKVEGRKGLLASQLSNFANTLEEVSRTLEKRGDTQQQKLVDTGARYVRKAAGMLQERSTEELFDEAQRQLRSHPAFAIAGAAALGFLGVRLLRS